MSINEAVLWVLGGGASLYSIYIALTTNPMALIPLIGLVLWVWIELGD